MDSKFVSLLETSHRFSLNCSINIPKNLWFWLCVGFVQLAILQKSSQKNKIFSYPNDLISFCLIWFGNDYLFLLHTKRTFPLLHSFSLSLTIWYNRNHCTNSNNSNDGRWWWRIRIWIYQSKLLQIYRLSSDSFRLDAKDILNNDVQCSLVFISPPIASLTKNRSKRLNLSRFR